MLVLTDAVVGVGDMHGSKDKVFLETPFNTGKPRRKTKIEQCQKPEEQIRTMVGSRKSLIMERDSPNIIINQLGLLKMFNLHVDNKNGSYKYVWFPNQQFELMGVKWSQPKNMC